MMGMSPNVRPAIVMCWTFAGLLVILFQRELPEISFTVGCFIVFVWIMVGFKQGPWLALKWTFPFIIPLLIIHGLINPSFESSLDLWRFVAYRPSGLIFAGIVSGKIFILTLAVTLWHRVDSDELLRSAVKRGFPLFLIVLISVAMATLRTIAVRAGNVYLAQQARGIPAGPGIVARVRALPTIVLPVITSTIREGIERGELMQSRGLGTTCLKLKGNDHRLSLMEGAFSLLPILAFLIGWLVL